MDLRRLAILAVGLILAVATALFAVSKLSPLLLPSSVNSDLLLAGVAISTAAFILAAMKDVIELAEKILGPGKAQIQKLADLITPERLAARGKRNRDIMLKKVQTDWVEDVLEKSLHGAVLLQLGMEYKPNMVERPWDMVLQRPDQPDQALPEKTKMIDVFDTFGGSFLILGDPGSGKTTALLELARDLIARARQNDSHPIPVVFNLSSWAMSESGLEDWLIDELNSKYQVPSYVGKSWVEQDELLLLLDGLDEVKVGHREICVDTINQFRHRHMVNVVVCSRISDYKELTNKLILPGAIIQKPLSSKQIDEYLRSLGKELKSVRTAVRTDATLQELARSPLVLSIIAWAYQGMALDDLGPGTMEERRNHLFSTYIKRMFEHRKTDAKYPPRRIVRGLMWLSKLMKNGAQSVFRIEQLQLDALSNPVARSIYLGSVSILVWVITMLSFGFACGIAVSYITGSSVQGAIAGGLYGLVGGLGMWIAVTGCYRLGYRILLGMAVGAAIAFTVLVVVKHLLISLIVGLPVGGATILAYGTIAGGTFSRNPLDALSTINTTRKSLGWSWQTGKVGFVRRLPLGLAFGLAAGLSTGSVFGWSFGLAAGIGFSLIAAIAGAISYGMMDVNVEPMSKPNEGTWRSFENALRFGVVSGLLVGTITGYLVGLLTNAVDGLIAGFLFFLAGFMIAGIIAGGFAVIQHCILRLLLSFYEDVPLAYPDFLNRAVHHIFLRKVGGGYIFMHRLLLEYFAEQQYGFVSV